MNWCGPRHGVALHGFGTSALCVCNARAACVCLRISHVLRVSPALYPISVAALLRAACPPCVYILWLQYRLVAFRSGLPALVPINILACGKYIMKGQGS